MSSRVSNYVKFRNVFGHSTSSYHPDALKIDTLQVDVFKVDKIWGPWKEKSLISQENYVSVPKSLFLSGLDQNISLYQRFLLMMKDFWRIIIWKIYFAQLQNKCASGGWQRAAAGQAALFIILNPLITL